MMRFIMIILPSSLTVIFFFWLRLWKKVYNHVVKQPFQGKGNYRCLPSIFLMSDSKHLYLPTSDHLWLLLLHLEAGDMETLISSALPNRVPSSYPSLAPSSILLCDHTTWCQVSNSICTTQLMSLPRCTQRTHLLRYLPCKSTMHQPHRLSRSFKYRKPALKTCPVPAATAWSLLQGKFFQNFNCLETLALPLSSKEAQCFGINPISKMKGS